MLECQMAVDDLNMHAFEVAPAHFAFVPVNVTLMIYL